MSTPLSDRRHRWTVAEYHRHIERGGFGPEDRIELIEGELIDMAPIGPDHASSVDVLNDELSARTRPQALVRVQNPIELGESSEPEPDVVLVRRRGDRYRHQHPQPDDIFLIVEVADTSLDYDRTVKVALYAYHHIPEVWLVDLVNRCVEVYREPEGDHYREVSTHHEGWIACGQLPDAWLQVEDLFQLYQKWQDLGKN